MTKYKIGDRVKVVRNEYGHEFAIGSFVVISVVDRHSKHNPYLACDESGENWWLSESEIISAEPEPEITVNGAVYILKPEPEHVWKFGDWARHPEHGVVFVLSGVDDEGNVWFAPLGEKDRSYTESSRLSYISTAEIPA